MQIYDDKKQRIGMLTGFKNRAITKTLDSGDKELSFEYPSNGVSVHLLKEEYYIRTKEDEFVLKAIETGEQYNKYTATLNVEELEGQSFPYGFASEEQTIRACLEFAFEGTGWTVGVCTVTKRRTIDIEEAATPWDVLQSCLSTYRCECEIDTLNKRINIYETIGRDRGCYFMEGLNLRKLTANSDTYEFYTRIIPIGKDGITIEWLHGKEYLENYQYSSKIKTYTWKDERYTNTTSLMEDADAKLEELSKPYKVFSADVVDLAKANPEYKNILDYGIGDTVRMVSRHPRTQEKQRIVKIVEYPETPEKNTVELSNTTKTFAEVQKTETELAKTEAISIANSTTKKILQDGYYTKTETESHITASAQAISLGVAEKYETKEIVSQKVSGAIETANAATDEKLTEYSTTQEMRSAIDMTAQSIGLSVSETYATKVSVTEKYNSAVEAGQNAADKAEAAANAATDEKLTEYSTTVEMDAILNLTKESILQQVKHVEESSMHDYIVNGGFTDGLNDWYVSDSENIAAIEDETLGTVAKILKSSTSSSYIRQSLGTLPAGTYRVRYKAATAAGYEATARVQCYAFGSTSTTKAGLLKNTEFTTIEREITVATAGTKYIYFYAYVQGSPIYIKDVEVLGQYSLYADAKLQVTAEEITSEVNKKVDETDFGTLITQNAYNVKIAWNKNSNYIQFEGTGITLYNGTIDDNQKRTVFNYTGEHFYLDGYYVGKIGTNQWSGDNSHKGLVFDLDYQGKYMAFAQKKTEDATAYTTMLCFSREGSIYDEYGIHLGCAFYGHNFALDGVNLRNVLSNGYSTPSAKIPIVTSITRKDDGSISWTYSTITVRDGIITNVPTSSESL